MKREGENHNYNRKVYFNPLFLNIETGTPIPDPGSQDLNQNVSGTQPEFLTTIIQTAIVSIHSSLHTSYPLAPFSLKRLP